MANGKTEDPSRNNFRHFILWGAILFPVLVIVNTVLFRFLSADKKESFFFVLASAIIVSWILMLTLYYVWAIYFYNINRGWTDKDWDERESNILIQDDVKEPEKNPNSEETLGLPPGTVRGTVALSVLVGAMAMCVASLAMPGKLAQNEFIVDNFEYFKTGFLMVIAFYFGSKSLELIGRPQVLGVSGPQSKDSPGNSTMAANNTGTSTPSVVPPTVVVGDISKGNKAEEKVTKDGAGDFEDTTAQG